MWLCICNNSLHMQNCVYALLLYRLERANSQLEKVWKYNN